MRISDGELGIERLISVTKSSIPSSKTACHGRKWDGFVLVLSGSAVYTFENKKPQVVSEGDIFFLAKDSVYAIDVSVDDYTFIFIDFVFSKPERVIENQIFHSRHFEKTANLFVKCNMLFHTGSLENRLYCKSMVYNIYADLVREQNKTYLPSRLRQTMDAALSHITEHYADPDLSVAFLARQCGMSEVYFRKLFHQLYRLSPIAFITAYRLSNASQLLAKTTLSVGEIAARSGFESAYYFSRVFKKHLGVTPMAYRREFSEI